MPRAAAGGCRMRGDRAGRVARADGGKRRRLVEDLQESPEMTKKHHLGRLIDHVHLRARDLEATKRFYKAVLGALGIPVGGEDADHIYLDELWIDALKGEQGSATHVHLAFQAADRDAVARFHAVG